jgi:hypothetical protein
LNWIEKEREKAKDEEMPELKSNSKFNIFCSQAILSKVFLKNLVFLRLQLKYYKSKKLKLFEKIKMKFAATTR